jgi:hypothetical protein
MNYTPKHSSRITPSIAENRVKIRSVDFESIEYRQTDTHTFIFIYIYIYIPDEDLIWVYGFENGFEKFDK